MNATDTPLVSVCLITYNHAPYIAGCIDSILQQQTDFPFEIVIGENRSGDGTGAICAAYAEKYPGKIRVSHREREDVIHINGAPTGRRNVIDTIAEARGTFIAICEGDDYWTDPQKLQKQASFLQAHPAYALCCARVAVVDENGKEQRLSPEEEKTDFTAADLAARNFIYTTTVMYRAENLRGIGSGAFLKVPAGDYFLHLHNARKGRIHFFPEVMAAYRIHGDGIWAGRSSVFQKLSLVQTQYILLEEFHDQPEITGALSATMQEHLDALFSLPEFDPATAFAGITDPRFVQLMRQQYHWHSEMRKAKARTEEVRREYEKSASWRIGKGITGLFRPFRRKDK